MSADDDEENPTQTRQLDIASLFPEKGDPRRPPEWFGRALIYVIIAVYVAIWVWRGAASIKSVVLILVISLFIALAMDPLVEKLVLHGWRRGAAAGVTLVGVCVAAVALGVVFGKMFIDQVIQMANALPNTYGSFVRWANEKFNVKLPDVNEIGTTVTDWITGHINNVANYAGQAWNWATSAVAVIFAIFTVLLVTYYISACSTKMRKSICSYISPHSQRRFLVTWTVLQDQISNFLYSRIILALISSACMSVFLIICKVPYWLPLSLFCGLVSQFIPTIGTYIGGAIPVLSAWGTNGLKMAIIVVVYICIYQQFENLLLSPKISQRTMDINPAVAFLIVVVFGYLFGALGAFLALPVWAAIQVLFKMYTKHYDLVDSPLLEDQVPVKKSAMVKGAEAIGEHVVRPVADRLPRVVRSSSASTIEDEYQQMIENELGVAGVQNFMGNTNETVAIRQGRMMSDTDDAGDVTHEINVTQSQSDANSGEESDADDALPDRPARGAISDETDVAKALRRRQNPAFAVTRHADDDADITDSADDDADTDDADTDDGDTDDGEGAAGTAGAASPTPRGKSNEKMESNSKTTHQSSTTHRSSDARPGPAKPRKSQHGARSEWK